MKKIFILVLTCISAHSVFATYTAEEFAPAIPRKQTTADSGEKFYCFNVVGDGDCGFYALEAPREIVIPVLINKLDNPDTLKLLHVEARNYYASADFDKFLTIEDKFDRADAEAFLNKRYVKPDDLAYGIGGAEYYLEAMPGEGMTGLIDWVAIYKKININVWQWHEGQDPAKGVRLIKKIFPNDDYRTIDIVIGDKHFSRLVNTDTEREDYVKNISEALAHECEWKKVAEAEARKISDRRGSVPLADLLKQSPLGYSMTGRTRRQMTPQQQQLPAPADTAPVTPSPVSVTIDTRPVAVMLGLAALVIVFKVVDKFKHR